MLVIMLISIEASMLSGDLESEVSGKAKWMLWNVMIQASFLLTARIC